MSDEGKHAPSVTLDNPTVIKEIRLGLGLRKERLEKLRKDEKAAGIGTNATDSRLRLHDSNGITALFADDHDGTMFEVRWPLKSVHDDPEIEPVVLANEDDTITWIVYLFAGMTDPDPKLPAAETPLPEWRWIDKDGKLYQLALGMSLNPTLAPRPPLEVVMGGKDEERPAPPPADKQLVDLARIAIKEETALSVQARTKTIEFMGTLEGEELDRFVSDWLDDAVKVDAKPKAPDIMPTKAADGSSYEGTLAAHLAKLGVGMNKTAMKLAHAREVPVKYLPETPSGSKGKRFVLQDVEDAINRWVSDTGADKPGDAVTYLHGVTIGKGKKRHLAVTEPDADSFYVDHAICGRDLGQKSAEVELEGLDDVCGNCVNSYEAGRTPDGGNSFEVKGA